MFDDSNFPDTIYVSMVRLPYEISIEFYIEKGIYTSEEHSIIGTFSFNIPEHLTSREYSEQEYPKIGEKFSPLNYGNNCAYYQSYTNFLIGAGREWGYKTIVLNDNNQILFCSIGSGRDVPNYTFSENYKFQFLKTTPLEDNIENIQLLNNDNCDIGWYRYTSDHFGNGNSEYLENFLDSPNNYIKIKVKKK